MALKIDYSFKKPFLFKKININLTEPVPVNLFLQINGLFRNNMRKS